MSGTGSGARSGAGMRWAGLALAVAVVALGVWMVWGDDEPDERGGAVVRAPVGASGAVGTPAPAPDASGPEALAPLIAAANPAVETPAPEELLAAALASAEHVLTGRIVRPDGTPVPGVALAAGVDPEEAFKVTTAAGWNPRRLPAGQVPVPSPRSDASGRFEVPLPAPARDLLVAMELEPCDLQVLQVGGIEPGRHDVGDLVLEYGASLTGRIVGPDGVGVSGAQVLAKGSNRHWRQPFDVRQLMHWLRSSFTPADGSFRIRGLLDPKEELTVSVGGWSGLTLRDLDVVPGQVRDLGAIVLSRGGVLGGVVQGPDGAPLGGVMLHARLQERRELREPSLEEHRGNPASSATTDEQGRFLVGGLVDGLYALHIEAPGFAMARFEGLITGRTDLTLGVHEGGRALIEVRSAVTDEPLTEASLRAIPPPEAQGLPWPRWGLPVVHGGEAGLAPGSYAVENIDPLGAGVRIEAPGFVTASVPIPGLGRGAVHAELVRLERALVLTGVALDPQDRPIEGVSLVFTPGDDVLRELPPASGRSDADGRLEVAGLAPGTWQASARHADFVKAGPEPRLLADEDVEGFLVRLQPAGRIEGLVLEPSGAPATQVQVLSMLLERHGWPALAGAGRKDALVSLPEGGGNGSLVMTDGDGRFVMSTLGPGDYLVTSTKGDQKAAFARLDALTSVVDQQLGTRRVLGTLPPGVHRVGAPSGQTVNVELILPQPAEVVGRVSVDGRARGDARVAALTRSMGGWNIAQVVSTDVGGQYHLAELDRGDWLIAAGVPGEPLSRARMIELEYGSRERVDLAFGGPSLIGQVLDADTRAPVAGLVMRLDRAHQQDVESIETVQDAEDQPHHALHQQDAAFSTQVVSGADGRMVFQHLLPGRYATTIESRDWELVSGNSWHDFEGTWTVGPVTFEVRQYATLEVSAVDDFTGAVPKEMLVRLTGLDPPEPRRRAPSRSEWLRDGIARIERLPPDTYQVQIEDRERGVLASERVVLAPGEVRRLAFRVAP